MTVSDAFAVPVAAAEVDDMHGAPADRARAYTRTRARDYRSLSVVRKIGDLAAVAWADVRSAWWTPASLPTLQRAWAERMPDRGTVPGGNAVLYQGWVVYNHTVGLAVPAAAIVVVGALTPLVWLARHPARLTLAVLIATPTVALIVK